MQQNERYFGVTTAQVAVGVSTVTAVLGGAYVTDIVITGATGSPVFFTGTSLAVATVVSTGVRLPTNIPYFLGNAPIYMSSVGGAAVVYIAKKLSDGFFKG